MLSRPSEKATVRVANAQLSKLKEAWLASLSALTTVKRGSPLPDYVSAGPQGLPGVAASFRGRKKDTV